MQQAEIVGKQQGQLNIPNENCDVDVNEKIVVLNAKPWKKRTHHTV